MTQKTGALIFDETADRYDIRFDLNDYYGGLRDIPFAFLAALMACPKALKSNFSLFCFIVISPNYIVYFIFLSRYDYTQHIID